MTMDETQTCFFNDKNEVYYRYNPIIQYAIKPALKLADAHNHPIRGGIAAAVASGLAHYSVIEIIAQGTDLIFGTNCVDQETKLAITHLSWPIHTLIGVNLLSNVLLGMGKYYKKQEKNSV